MNEFTHLNQYSTTDLLHQRAGTPYHRSTSGGRRSRRRSARHTVAAGLHRLAERLDG